MIKQNKTLNLVQVLRGVASLLVVLLHTTVNSKEILHKNFCFDFFLFGGSGVDIFFVLSGFIITYTSVKGLTHPKKLLPFIRRRFVRIFPTYWIIITIFILLQVALPSFYRTHYPFTFANVCSTYFLLPNHIMVNGVSWTLSYELFFYLIFSLAFLLPNKKLAFILSMPYALAIIAIAIVGYHVENGGKWTILITHPMNVEFCMGILAAVLVQKISRILWLPLIVTGVLLFLAAGIFTDHNYYLMANGFNRVLIFGIPSFMIITGLVKLEINKSVNVHNILLSLGEASYSLYLLHLPLIVACIKIIDRLAIRDSFILHIVLFSAIAIICYASILFFKWIEKPIITKLNARGKNKVFNSGKTAGG